MANPWESPLTIKTLNQNKYRSPQMLLLPQQCLNPFKSEK